MSIIPVISIFYIGLRYFFSNKKYSVHSYIHIIVSEILSIYSLSQMTGNLLTYSSLNDINLYLIKHPEAIKQLYFPVHHSIAYFIGDTVYSLFVSEYTYIFHHFISIAGLSSIFLNSHVGCYALILAEIGGIFHHIKKYENVIKNKVLRLLVIFSYYFIYGYTRYLMLANVIHFSFYANKYIDYFQILLTFPLVLQNLFWMRKNWKQQKI
jgi:hypothetical protein